MIAGNNNQEFLNELKYNMSEKDYHTLASIKKGITQKIDYIKDHYEEMSIAEQFKAGEDYDILERLSKSLVNSILPAIYNKQNGHKIQSQTYLNEKGNVNKVLEKNIMDFCNFTGTEAKYSDGETNISKILNATRDSLRYSYKKYEEENEQNGKNQTGEGDGDCELTKLDIENAKQEVSKQIPKSQNTCNKEEEQLPLELYVPDMNRNSISDLEGYKALSKWIMKVSQSTVKKEITAIEKMSDLQKISASEFVKPRGLLMKKLVNKELYIRKKKPVKRKFHMMSDRSGSMLEFLTWRNIVMTNIFNTCNCAKIDLSHEHFLCGIYPKGDPQGIQEIKSENDLIKHMLSNYPRGGENVGRSVVDRLKLMKRTDDKQFLLCVSDGTGSIESDEQGDLIYRMCAQKNIDLKFVLFSEQNDMKNIKKSDIFYICGNLEQLEKENRKIKDVTSTPNKYKNNMSNIFFDF